MKEFFIEWKNVILIVGIIWGICGMLARAIVCEKTRGATYDMNVRKDQYRYWHFQRVKRKLTLQGPIGLIRVIFYYRRVQRDLEYARVIRAVSGE